jgi:hypothetical protein
MGDSVHFGGLLGFAFRKRCSRRGTLLAAAHLSVSAGGGAEELSGLL